MSQKPRARTTTSARVTLTIELSNLGSWGPDCLIDQVYRQAIEAARARVSRAFSGAHTARIIGTPIVQAITTDMEQRS